MNIPLLNEWLPLPVALTRLRHTSTLHFLVFFLQSLLASSGQYLGGEQQSSSDYIHCVGGTIHIIFRQAGRPKGVKTGIGANRC